MAELSPLVLHWYTPLHTRLGEQSEFNLEKQHLPLINKHVGGNMLWLADRVSNVQHYIYQQPKYNEILNEILNADCNLLSQLNPQTLQ